MRRILAAILFGLLGYVVGFFAGVEYACSGPNAGNLCGLLGAFITGPIAGAGGVTLALRIFDRRG